ncbi:MAG: hypothetical protein ACRDWY_09850 [Actinomycetes bacterium]
MTTHPTLPPYAGSTRPAESLRGLCGGAVHVAGGPAYDVARMPWNAAVDQRPAAVAYPASAREVAEVVTSARRAGLRAFGWRSGLAHAGARRRRADQG